MGKHSGNAMMQEMPAADNVLCGDIVPMGMTAGQLSRNRDCPDEIGTADMSALKELSVL